MGYLPPQIPFNQHIAYHALSDHVRQIAVRLSPRWKELEGNYVTYRDGLIVARSCGYNVEGVMTDSMKPIRQICSYELDDRLRALNTPIHGMIVHRIRREQRTYRVIIAAVLRQIHAMDDLMHFNRILGWKPLAKIRIH